MATEVRLRRGTAAEHEVFAGAPAEVTVDTTNNTLRVHDGETLGGHETMPRGILPSPIVPDTFLQAKADGSGYEARTAGQVAEVVGPLIRAASQDEAGIVQLADAATAQGLTDAQRALTPATLAAAFQGWNQLLADNGYQRLPGGLILQWGRGRTLTSGALNVVFPVAFPNACVAVVGTALNNTIGSDTWEISVEPSKTGFACAVVAVTSGGIHQTDAFFRYIAIGY